MADKAVSDLTAGTGGLTAGDKLYVVRAGNSRVVTLTAAPASASDLAVIEADLAVIEADLAVIEADLAVIEADLAGKQAAAANLDAWSLLAPATKQDAMTKASQAEAQAGTDDTHWMTPLRTADAIAANQGSTLINSTTVGAAVASIVFTGTWTQYKNLMIVIWELTGSVSTPLKVEVSADGGATYETWTGNESYIGASSAGSGASTGAQTTYSDSSYSGVVYVLGSDGSGTVKGSFWMIQGEHFNSSRRKTAAINAINAVKISPVSGTYTSGTVELYGIR